VRQGRVDEVGAAVSDLLPTRATALSARGSRAPADGEPGTGTADGEPGTGTADDGAPQVGR